MSLLPVYIKRIDGLVHVFKDEACTSLFAWYSKGRGPRTRTTIVLNCYTWRCVYV